MDQIVRELLTSTGGTFVNPSTNYYQVERDGLKITSVAQVFMGMRIQCPMSQPSFRQMDPRRLLLFRFFLRSDRSQKSGRSSRIHNLQPQERRNQSPDPQQTLASQVPRGRAPEIKRGSDRRAVMAGWHPRRTPSSPAIWQT